MVTRRRGVNYISPESLKQTASLVSEFARRRSIIYMEGIEYLMANNGFDAVKTLLDHLSDIVTVSGAVLVYSVDPDILEEKEKALLERFATVIAE